MKSLVIIPTKNSDKYILDVITELESSLHDIDYLVIDYGSTDTTNHLLANNHIPRLELPLEASYFKALSLGLMYASQKGYDAVVEFDDRGIFNAADINYLLATYKNQNTDYVLTSRFVNSQKNFKKEKAFWIRSSIRLVLGKKITDPTMRFKLYGKVAIDFFGKDGYYDPSIDRIVQTIRNGLSFIEVATKTRKQKQAVITGRKYRNWKFAMVLSILFVKPFKHLRKEEQ